MEDQATAHTRVRDRIRDDIFSGALPPGCRLTVSLLAKRYRVSPMPIRTALQELRGQGLVTGEPRKGARVRSVDAEFVSNVYDLRIAILRLIYARCVRFITNADIELLEAIQDSLEAADARSDRAEIRKWNRRYHQIIAELSRNAEAAAVMDRNWSLVDAMRGQYGFGLGRICDANHIHREVIEALRRRDAEAAYELARTSAERSRDDLIALVQRSAAPASLRSSGAEEGASGAENEAGEATARAAASSGST